MAETYQERITKPLSFPARHAHYELIIQRAREQQRFLMAVAAQEIEDRDNADGNRT